MDNAANTKKLSPEEIKQHLPSFTGTTQWHIYKSLTGKMKLTDGIMFVAESCGAFWMVDLIASYQVKQNIADERFQVYNFTKDDDGGMDVEIQDGNYNTFATQHIDYTDFPLDELTIWFVGDVALLPSEY